MAQVSMDLSRQDTICALATPLAPAALAIIRVSGPDAMEIKKIVFQSQRGTQKEFVATLGWIMDPQTTQKVDEALCTFFPDGQSYTGESAFELSLHGNPRLVQRILEILQANGCRLARPGEFTLRAVLTGKLDLCAAESVQDLISAGSKVAAQAALRGLEGGLKKELQPVRALVIRALAEMEARMDFPEDELGEAVSEELLSSFQQTQKLLGRLLDSAPMGQRLTQGARVVLMGPPNVGKSTLLNTLIGEDRALVFNQPGTTRDVLEANWILEGIPILLIDVAGVRATEQMDPVEKMGIEKAKTQVMQADLILILSEATSVQDETLGSLLEGWGVSGETPRLCVHTKSDLVAERANSDSAVLISAKNRQGLDQLKSAMSQILVTGDLHTEEIFLTRNRQKEEVNHCLRAIEEAEKALRQGWADEVITSELRQAGKALDRLLGLDLNEDVLDTIFSQFCIGK